jgi:hypothetical protein
MSAPRVAVPRIAVCLREGEDGCTVVAVVPRGHVTPPYLPLGLTLPASVIYSDCVAVAARVLCDGSVVPMPGGPRNLPSARTPPAPRRLDTTALHDAIALFGPFKLHEEYCAVLGVRLLDRPYLMCVADVEKALELPFGHSIYRVTSVRWAAVTPAHFVPISERTDSAPKRPNLTRKDANRLSHFLAYDWGAQDSIYFADAIDVCSPFPFGCTEAAADQPWATSQRADEFGCDWGRSLRQPFDAAGVGAMCSPFMRGFALGNVFGLREDAAKTRAATAASAASAGGLLGSPVPVSVASPPPPPPSSPSSGASAPAAAGGSSSSSSGAPSETAMYFFMMGQQHSGNPAPRFFGRGLNESGHAGNDLVFQLVAWRYRQAERGGWEVQWARHIFLRGTAPVRFKSKMAAGIGEATIVVGDDALEGSAAYLAEQVTKCQRLSTLPAAVEEPKDAPRSDQPRLRCVNLLKAVSAAGEHKVGALFDQSVRRVAASGLPIDIEHVDWLGIEAKFGVDAAALRIWNVALLFMDGQGGRACSAGSFPLRVRVAPPPPPPPGSDGGAASAGAPPLPSVHRVTVQQNRYVRYNCADSLDRTNLASFFVVAQLSSRLFLTLDVMLDRLVTRLPANPALYDNGVVASPATQALPLSPAGSPATLQDLKENLDDELPDLPPETELPPCFFHSIDDLAQSLHEPVLRALVELFVTNGDTIAKLFTATQAIHTSHMRKLVTGIRGASPNALISAQRRFENTFRDKKKFRVVDIIVGKDTVLFHMPSVPPQYFAWPLPKPHWPCAVALRVMGTTVAIDAADIRAALPEAARGEVVEIRGVVLATGRDPDDPNGGPVMASPGMPMSPASGNPPSFTSPSATPRAAAAVAGGAAAARSGASSSATPATPAAGDDDAPRDPESADFSFLRFERLFSAVLLMRTPEAAAAVLAARQLLVAHPAGDRVPAIVTPYAYEAAADETPACLRVREAERALGEQSTLSRISNFARSLFK